MYQRKAAPPLLALSLVLSLAMPAQQVAAAEPEKAKTTAAVPPEASAKKACTTATGATKAECEKVAKQIDAQRADPQSHPTATSDADRAPSQEIHHSSPIMETTEEKAAAAKKAEAAASPAQKPAYPESEKPKP
jgi:hypothetical protein